MRDVLQLDTRPAAAATTTDGAAAVLAYARAQIGKPYEWGSAGPDTFDCSGLVQAAYKDATGVTLPRTTAQLALVGEKVAKADLQPGDLVFPNPGHVQLYSGGGNVVEAPKKGEPVREVPMWGFMTARRVLGTNAGTGGLTVLGVDVIGAIKSGLSAVPGVSDVADLASAMNPAKWGPELQTVGLRLAVVGAGLGLALLGAYRMVAGATGDVIDKAKEAVL